MIALNILNAYRHGHKLIVFIYILEAGPSEVAVNCDRQKYVCIKAIINTSDEMLVKAQSLIFKMF